MIVREPRSTRRFLSFLGEFHPPRSSPLLLQRVLNVTEFTFILSPNWTSCDSYLVRCTGAMVFLLEFRWLPDSSLKAFIGMARLSEPGQSTRRRNSQVWSCLGCWPSFVGSPSPGQPWSALRMLNDEYGGWAGGSKHEVTVHSQGCED